MRRNRVSLKSSKNTLLASNNNQQINAEKHRQVEEDDYDSEVVWEDDVTADAAEFGVPFTEKIPTVIAVLGYVQNVLASLGGGFFSELQWKFTMNAATTSALPANTANVAYTELTASVNGAFPAIDGVTITELAYQNFLLVKDEVDKKKNGLYYLSDPGSVGTPWVLIRTGDANSSGSIYNAIVCVAQGTINGNTLWRQQTKPFILATDDAVFERLGFKSVGGGLTLTTEGLLMFGGTAIDDVFLNIPADKTLNILGGDGRMQAYFGDFEGAGYILLSASDGVEEGFFSFTPNSAYMQAFTCELRTDGTAVGHVIIDKETGFGVITGGLGRLTIDNDGNVVFNLGSDTEGDIYYRNAAGNFVRLPIGLPTEVLTTVAGKPSWQPPLNPDIDSFYKDFTDYYESTLSGGWAWVSFGSGATTVMSDYGVDSTEKASGVISLTTGTTTTGETHHYKGHAGGFPTAFLIGNGSAISLKWRAALGAVSDGTNTFSVTLGLGDQVNAKDQSNGVYFTYTHGVNGGKWQAVTANGGTRTTVDTGVAASTSYQVLELRINEAGTEVKFYVDGSLVVTTTTNLPSSTTCAIMVNIVKSLGTSSRSLYLDYYQFQTQRSTAR